MPFSRIAVGRPAKDRPVKLVVQLPVNASFATAVRVHTSDADPGLTAPFARCVPGGCFAEFDLKEETLRKLRAASGVGKLSSLAMTRVVAAFAGVASQTFSWTMVASTCPDTTASICP